MGKEEKTEKFQHKKSLGQHFLNNPGIPKKIANAGDVQKGDCILEIGPGTGALTRELLGRGARVVAVEADSRAITALEDLFSRELADGRLTLVHGDARTIDLKSLGFETWKYKVVANIPYYLSGILFRTFLETDIQPNTLVFLVQREVAERIARDPKESILSLSVKVFGTPRYVETVKPGNFTPQPKVDSAIIAISNISKERLSDLDSRDFFTLIHAGFQSKRKQLLGNLSQIWEREEVAHSFSTLGIPLNVRGEDVPLELWLKLLDTLPQPKK